jgi:hypothetical protein
MCANVNLDGPNDLGTLRRGDCFEWRHITNDGRDRQRKWVMGKIRHKRKNPEAGAQRRRCRAERHRELRHQQPRLRRVGARALLCEGIDNVDDFPRPPRRPRAGQRVTVKLLFLTGARNVITARVPLQLERPEDAAPPVANPAWLKLLGCPTYTDCQGQPRTRTLEMSRLMHRARITSERAV